MEAVAPEMEQRVLQYRATSPSTERLGAHEGPFTLALTYAADPLQPPMYPETDLQMATAGHPV
jgi:hypothetical protein